MGRAAGVVLLVAAGVTLVTQVQVHGAGASTRSCGSAWDVVAGRVGWPQWWAQDLADPVAGDRLVRTQRCPDAVNRLVVLSGVLAGTAVAVVSAGELAERRRRPRVAEARALPVRRLRTLATVVSLLGVVLTVAGLAGVALLVADPGAPLFLYVGRPVVVLAGLVLLLPAVLLVVLGRGAGLLAERWADDGRAGEDP